MVQKWQEWKRWEAWQQQFQQWQQQVCNLKAYDQNFISRTVFSKNFKMLYMIPHCYITSFL